MRSILLLVTILLVLVLINNADGQGSPAASIGAYITKYREKQKLKAAREKKRRNQTRNPYAPVRQRDRVDCNGFLSYYEPCRYYYN